MTEFIRRTHWTVLDRVAAALSGLLALGFLLWATIGTAAFMRPGVITYHLSGDVIEARFDRVVRGPGVWLEWHSECESLNGGGERIASGRAFYQSDTVTATYDIGPELTKCFKAGVPIRFVHKWQARAFGLIPLRPVTSQYVIEIPPTAVMEATSD